MKRVLLALLFLFGLAIALRGGNPGGSRPSSEDRQSTSAIAACATRGIAYFKEIGSYPRPKSAPETERLADDIALERCSRTITAF